MRRLATTRNDSLYAVLREAEGKRVVAFLNLTAGDITAEAHDPALAGSWRDAFTGEEFPVPAAARIVLRAWKYRVLVSKE